jgi:uncharacterized protein
MTDELTKPLGLEQPPPRSGRFWASLALVVTATIAIMAGYVALRHGELRQAEVVASESTPTGTAAQAAKNTENVADATPAGAKKRVPAKLETAVPTGRIAVNLPPAEFERRDGAVAHLPDPELLERVSSGFIPQRSPDNRRPMDVYSRLPTTEGNFGVARVVLIVGGLGISQTGTQQAIRMLPPTVTLAFAPYGNSLERWMQEARKNGHELLLQVPMEPFDLAENSPGKQTLRTDADEVENIANLHWFMSRITNYVGLINYLGGKFVTDRQAMKPVFDDVAERGLLYVDDGSVRNSLAKEAAESSLLPYAGVDMQLDLIRDRRKIKESLDRLAEQAKRTGIAIGYANAFADSIAVIADFARKSTANGIEITPLTAIVHDPESE